MVSLTSNSAIAQKSEAIKNPDVESEFCIKTQFDFVEGIFISLKSDTTFRINKFINAIKNYAKKMAKMKK